MAPVAHHTDRLTVWRWLGEHEFRRFHAPRALHTCSRGHEGCSLHPGGPCHQDVRALLDCPDCKGESQPFDGYPSCGRCGSIGWVRDNSETPINRLLPGVAA